MLMVGLLLLLGLPALSAGGEQQAGLTLDPSRISLNVGLYLQILEDPGTQLGIDQAASFQYAERFRHTPRKTLYLKPSPYPRWVRLSIKAPSVRKADVFHDHWHLGLTGPIGPVRCALYIPASAWSDPPPQIYRQGAWLIQEISWPGGGSDPRRPGGHRTLILPSPEEPATVYLAMQVAHDQYLPLTVMPGSMLVPDSRWHGLLLGLAMGMVAGLMAYNLSVFFILRDAAYLYHILLVTSVEVIIFSEIGGFPIPWVSSLGICATTRMDCILLLVGDLSFILFCLRFFHLKERGSILHRPVLWFLWAQVAILPLYILLPMAVLGPVASVVLILCQVILWIVTFQGIAHKLAGARLYALAYALVSLGIWSYWSCYFGWVPYHCGFIYALPIGVVFESLVFTLALHYRMDDMRRQKEIARERYIDLLVKSQHQQEQLHEYGLLLQKSSQNQTEPDAAPGTEAPGLMQKLNELSGIRARLTERQQELEQSLEEKSEALAEANTALKVLFERLNAEKAGVEEDVSLTVRKLVIPAMERLKASRLSSSQREYVQMMETALGELASRSITTLASVEANLSSAEAQVALLIRNGKASKEIAEVLNISEHTVAAHRKSIRSKLGLAGRQVNLAAHLRERA